jgi:hypothetical protein
MMIRSRGLLVMAGLLTGLTTTLPAQGTPTAAQIHDRFVKALGGRAAIEAQTARHTWGAIEIPSQGMKGTLEVWAAAPDKMHTRIEIPGFGLSQTGFDGETAYTSNPAMGAQILDGRALDQLRQQVDMHGVLHPERYVTSAEFAGEADFEGKRCYKVTVTTTWEEEYTEYYDIETGLLYGMARSQESPMGAIEATTVLENYERHGGIMTPMLIRIQAMGMEQVVRSDSISVAPIPDSIFALPAEIKALKKGS